MEQKIFDLLFSNKFGEELNKIKDINEVFYKGEPRGYNSLSDIMFSLLLEYRWHSSFNAQHIFYEKGKGHLKILKDNIKLLLDRPEWKYPEPTCNWHRNDMTWDLLFNLSSEGHKDLIEKIIYHPNFKLKDYYKEQVYSWDLCGKSIEYLIMLYSYGVDDINPIQYLNAIESHEESISFKDTKNLLDDMVELYYFIIYKKKNLDLKEPNYPSDNLDETKKLISRLEEESFLFNIIKCKAEIKELKLFK
jgi:hypothetical protein